MKVTDVVGVAELDNQDLFYFRSTFETIEDLKKSIEYLEDVYPETSSTGQNAIAELNILIGSLKQIQAIDSRHNSYVLLTKEECIRYSIFEINTRRYRQEQNQKYLG